MSKCNFRIGDIQVVGTDAGVIFTKTQFGKTASLGTYNSLAEGIDANLQNEKLSPKDREAVEKLRAAFQSAGRDVGRMAELLGNGTQNPGG